MLRRSIELGVTKFNVNTEIRGAYVAALRELLDAPEAPDLLDLMENAIVAMEAVISTKLSLFGSAGREWHN